MVIIDLESHSAPRDSGSLNRASPARARQHVPVDVELTRDGARERKALVHCPSTEGAEFYAANGIRQQSVQLIGKALDVPPVGRPTPEPVAQKVREGLWFEDLREALLALDHSRAADRQRP